MKTLLPVLFTCLLAISFQTSAQELVPDPGFEMMKKKPSKTNNQVSCTQHWRGPTFAGTDYYHASAEKHAGTPKNIFGKQQPHSGKAYGGICIHKKYIEHLATALKDTLVKGQNYLVEFYISRAERSIGSVKEFGVLFTKKIWYSNSQAGIPVKPSVDHARKRKYRNKREWTKLSAVYTADGTETTLIVGYFNYKRPKGQRVFCHYYIDDVSVTPIEKTEQKEDSVVIVKTEDPDPETFLPKIGETITLQNIFFKTNKSELLPESFSELDKLVYYLNELPATSINISGHTDNTGNENQNKMLSASRAKAVADYLTLKGIDASRINYMGYGSLKPVASNENDEGKQQNRRVEFVINKK